MLLRRLVWHVTLLVLVVCLCAAVAPAATTAAAGLVNIELRADPDSLPADGDTQAVIIAEVTSLTGAPVPNGTLVYFSADLGDVVSPVQTVGGLAQTAYTAPSTSGFATISAMAAGSRATVQVELLAMAGSGTAGSRLAELTADEVSYSADRGMLIATWHAQLLHRAMTLDADSIQYDVVKNSVRAQGNVVLKAGKHEQRADALSYDLLAHRGRLIRLTPEKAERLLVEGDRLEVRPDTSEDAALWEPANTDDTRTWVKARRVLIEPGRRLILDHAVVYVDDTRVVSLPRQVLPPTPGRAIFSSVLGFSTLGGVRLDFPYYYQASGNTLGSLTLRRNSLAGGPGTGLGWSLQLREEYGRSGLMNGSFTVDDITHPTQGVSFDHSQRFGQLRLNLNAATSTPYGQDYQFRGGTVGLSYPVGEGALALSVGGSTYNNSEERSTSLAYQFGGRVIGHGITVAPNMYVRQSSRHVGAQELLIDPVTGEPLEITGPTDTTATSTGFDVSLGMPSRKLKNGMTLTGSGAVGANWAMGGAVNPALRARFTLERQMGKEGRMTLTYSGSYHPGDVSLLSGARHLLTLAGRGVYKDVGYTLSYSRDIAEDRQYGMLTLSKPLPFGKSALGIPLWSVQATHMLTHLRQYDTQSTKFSLTRNLGRLEASLNYSPQGLSPYGASYPWLSPLGVGYTYSGGRHLWLEVGSPLSF